MQQTEIFVILGHLLPFSSLTTRKIKILNLKKIPGDIIILHICNINDNHMMYGYRDTEHNREFIVILDHFLPFYPPNKPKNQNFEKMKKLSGDIIILHRHTINYNHMMYGSWDMEYDRQFFVILDRFLSFYPPTSPKINILKKWKKNPGDIIILQ